MSAQYTTKEFNSAGLEPKECDAGPFGYRGIEYYWFPCSYHEGYIDGFRDAIDVVDQTAQGVTE